MGVGFRVANLKETITFFFLIRLLKIARVAAATLQPDVSFGSCQTCTESTNTSKLSKVLDAALFISYYPIPLGLWNIIFHRTSLQRWHLKFGLFVHLSIFDINQRNIKRKSFILPKKRTSVYILIIEEILAQLQF